MWRPIQIELQSIDIKDCDSKRDLSTLLLSITDIDLFFSFIFCQKISTVTFNF